VPCAQPLFLYVQQTPIKLFLQAMPQAIMTLAFFLQQKSSVSHKTVSVLPNVKRRLTSLVALR
jgi:hypothetical protein